MCNHTQPQRAGCVQHTGSSAGPFSWIHITLPWNTWAHSLCEADWSLFILDNPAALHYMICVYECVNAVLLWNFMLPSCFVFCSAVNKDIVTALTWLDSLNWKVGADGVYIYMSAISENGLQGCFERCKEKQLFPLLFASAWPPTSPAGAVFWWSGLTYSLFWQNPDGQLCGRWFDSCGKVPQCWRWRVLCRQWGSWQQLIQWYHCGCSTCDSCRDVLKLLHRCQEVKSTHFPSYASFKMS